MIGTYGRGFWLLDDMNPLRDIAAQPQQIAAAPAYLFKPGDAIRSRMNSNWDQPMNPEMPHAPNPPFGALLYYHTKAEVDTWESGCKEFAATLNAWKAMLDVDPVGFKSLLTKNNLMPLKLTATELAAPTSCTFVWPPRRRAGANRPKTVQWR